MGISFLILILVIAFLLGLYLGDNNYFYKDVQHRRIKAFSKMLSKAEPKHHAIKLIEEAKELAEEPTDLEEYADCYICLLSGLYKAGYNTEILYTSVGNKLDVLDVSEMVNTDDNLYRRIKKK